MLCIYNQRENPDLRSKGPRRPCLKEATVRYLERLERFFPLSDIIGTPRSAARAIGLYLVLAIVCNLVTLFLGWIPYLGALIQILAILTGLYGIAGILLTLRNYHRLGWDKPDVDDLL